MAPLSVGRGHMYITPVSPTYPGRHRGVPMATAKDPGGRTIALYTGSIVWLASGLLIAELLGIAEEL